MLEAEFSQLVTIMKDQLLTDFIVVNVLKPLQAAFPAVFSPSVWSLPAGIFPILRVFLSCLRAFKSDLHSLWGLREALNTLALSRDVASILLLTERPPFYLC